jgi:hypothetical protein
MKKQNLFLLNSKFTQYKLSDNRIMLGMETELCFGTQKICVIFSGVSIFIILLLIV